MSKFIPYHEESVEYAKQMVEGETSAYRKYKKITGFVSRCFSYDYIRAIQIQKKNGLPDVERCWNLRMGICFDLAAMTVGMLDAAGVYAILCVGKADGIQHAWVEAVINGRRYRFDHPHKAEKYVTEKRYRPDRR